MKVSHHFSGRHPAWFAAWTVGVVSVAVLLLWMPFGFRLTGLIEEWGLLGLFSEHGLFYVADRSSPLAAHALRPFTVLPQAIAYRLDPSSFDYWNLLLLASVLVKAGVMSYLAAIALRSARWGLACGLLAMLYPADTMQLSLRSLHINWSLDLLLASAAALLQATALQRPAMRASLAVLAAALLFLAVGMYEAALPLAIMPFVIRLVGHGPGGLAAWWRAQWRLCAIYGAGVVMYGLYAALNFPKAGGYQGSLAGGLNVVAFLAGPGVKLFSVGLMRSVAGGWFDAARIATTTFSAWGIAYFAFAGCAVALLVGSAGRGSARQPSAAPETGPTTPWARAMAGGLLLCLLGYLPYLFSLPHLYISQRTFLFAAPGAALACTAALAMVGKGSRTVAAGTLAAMLSLAFAAQLHQFDHYVRLSERQRQHLRDIVDRLPAAPAKPRLLILDQTDELGSTWMFLPPNLQAAIAYFTGKTAPQVDVCHMPSGEWQATGAFGRKGTCVPGPDGWHLRAPVAVVGAGQPPAPAVPDVVLPPDRTDVIIAPLQHVPARAGDAAARAEGTAGARDRYDGVLGPAQWPLSFDILRSPTDPHRYRWDFGDWWSLELPIRGSGWREAEWTVGYLRHNAAAWKYGKAAELSFQLDPLPMAYAVRGTFSAVVNPVVAKSLEVRINGALVDVTLLQGGRFSAQVAPGILQAGVNSISFDSATDADYYGLSFMLDEVEIEPR